MTPNRTFICSSPTANQKPRLYRNALRRKAKILIPRHHKASVLASATCISNALKPHNGKLDDKVAIITGGAGGIGAAAARRFTDEGAKAMLVYMNEDVLRKIISDIGDYKAA
jgi:FlaA1/EpsC-like NDP-sugar epimerase